MRWKNNWLAGVSSWLAGICSWQIGVSSWLAEISSWPTEVFSWLAGMSSCLAGVSSWWAAKVECVHVRKVDMTVSCLWLCTDCLGHQVLKNKPRTMCLAVGQSVCLRFCLSVHVCDCLFFLALYASGCLSIAKDCASMSPAVCRTVYNVCW